MKNDAINIYTYAINACMPKSVVENGLKNFVLPNGKLFVVSIGKAGFSMAKTASEILKDNIYKGIIITKYNHSKGNLKNFEIFEAGHPLPDNNSLLATNRVLELTKNLTTDDKVLFLVSGGGSALFESIDFPLQDLQDLTNQLLSCGASINEINTIRKHISNVKGGKFTKHCYPCEVFSIILSDVIGDDIDLIASGPSVLDTSTIYDVKNIITKYNLKLSKNIENVIFTETPKNITNSTYVLGGSVKELCTHTAFMCKKLGYSPIIISDRVVCEAKKLGEFLSDLANAYKNTPYPLAFIVGGETIVNIKGNGKGGRNQEIAVSSIKNISTLKNTLIFSIGSDGTDGPTDSAGGIVDENTYSILEKLNINVLEELNNNNSYYVLDKCNGLIKTGPTGTNVNDVSVLLIKNSN